MKTTAGLLQRYLTEQELADLAAFQKIRDEANERIRNLSERARLRYMAGLKGTKNKHATKGIRQ